MTWRLYAACLATPIHRCQCISRLKQLGRQLGSVVGQCLLTAVLGPEQNNWSQALRRVADIRLTLNEQLSAAAAVCMVKLFVLSTPDDRAGRVIHQPCCRCMRHRQSRAMEPLAGSSTASSRLPIISACSQRQPAECDRQATSAR